MNELSLGFLCLLLFCGLSAITAILMIIQELVHWVRDKKLAQISVLPIILCPLAGLAYGTRLPAPVVVVMIFCMLPVIRVLLAFRMKTPPGYWLILIPAATVCLTALYSLFTTSP